MGKSGQTPSISFTGVLAVQEPKLRDSSDMVTQEQPLAIFDTDALMYAVLLSVRLHPYKNQIRLGATSGTCRLLPGLLVCRLFAEPMTQGDKEIIAWRWRGTPV
jgi:hypothetical protein